MYTLHITWPERDYYYIMDNVIIPAAECCITVGSHAFPRLVDRPMSDWMTGDVRVVKAI